MLGAKTKLEHTWGGGGGGNMLGAKTKLEHTWGWGGECFVLLVLH